MYMLQTRHSLDVPGLGARLLVLLCTVEASLYQTHWSLFPAWVRVSTGLFPAWVRVSTGLFPAWVRVSTGLFLSISSLLIY